MVSIMNKNRKSTYKTTKHTKESGDKMPTVEKVNYEMSNYLRDIEEYIKQYKKLPEQEAKKLAKENLMDAGIIDAQGNLTDFYKNS